ncbi:FliM/FliN family flagellar motor switch protein [Tautonia sociabilis]|uniref:Flagellar motor switch/type III secretory pathway protein n=1 Tax=Tautonia sociabilis TaxID=2080755 RepID=A0A432MK72_9BACT|nr:FliM/FliN family flagellar motor switch protein [Tautonia sociabilis]RUL87814.1 flagellar motor switch/type III secretory pathway protein [Tautonia sociabilis]
MNPDSPASGPDSDPEGLNPAPRGPSASLLPSADPPGPSSSSAPAVDPLGDLPRIARRHARLAMRLDRAEPSLRPLLDELAALVGQAPLLSRADVIPRASGLRRPGAIAQFGWPRLGTRIGLGIEPALAHAIVDRLLGFERSAPEHRLQVSPVEWGVLGFVVARLLDRLACRPGVLGPWDLYVDRVGPEPFPPDGLGPIVTLAWPLRVPPASGVIRLWVPEVVVALALVDDPEPPPPPGGPDELSRRFGVLTCLGRAEAGTIPLPGGLKTLRVGQSHRIAGGLLQGMPASPRGEVAVILGDAARRWLLPASPVPDSGASRLTVTGPISRRPRPQEASPVPPSVDFHGNDTVAPSGPPSPPASPSPADVPVTLVVELGRLSLPVSRVADLKPGDVLDLARSSSDPIDLTSGGTLVARGELVRLDSALGIRITRVFL